VGGEVALRGASQMRCAGRGKSAGVPLVHGVQNALRQEVRPLFMGQVAEAWEPAYVWLRLSLE
jgi:hypothetical protein